MVQQSIIVLHYIVLYPEFDCCQAHLAGGDE